MGFRLRYTRRIRLAPGLRLNLSKSGVSTTFGGHGLTYTVQRGGRRRTTVGLPGTGVYFTKVSRVAPGSRPSPSSFWIGLLALAVLAWLAFRAA